MVERCERTNHAHHRIGHTAIVGCCVGQVLNFANDVVTQKAHQPALQRWQVGEERRLIVLQDAFECGEDAVVEWHVGG